MDGDYTEDVSYYPQHRVGPYLKTGRYLLYTFNGVFFVSTCCLEEYLELYILIREFYGRPFQSWRNFVFL